MLLLCKIEMRDDKSRIPKNIDKIDWINLSSNPNAIHLLEQNIDKIYYECFEYLSENPNAIKYGELTTCGSLLYTSEASELNPTYSFHSF